MASNRNPDPFYSADLNREISEEDLLKSAILGEKAWFQIFKALKTEMAGLRKDIQALTTTVQVERMEREDKRYQEELTKFEQEQEEA